MHTTVGAEAPTLWDAGCFTDVHNMCKAWYWRCQPGPLSHTAIYALNLVLPLTHFLTCPYVSHPPPPPRFGQSAGEDELLSALQAEGLGEELSEDIVHTLQSAMLEAAVSDTARGLRLTLLRTLLREGEPLMYASLKARYAARKVRGCCLAGEMQKGRADCLALYVDSKFISGCHGSAVGRGR